MHRYAFHLDACETLIAIDGSAASKQGSVQGRNRIVKDEQLLLGFSATAWCCCNCQKKMPQTLAGRRRASTDEPTAMQRAQPDVDAAFILAEDHCFTAVEIGRMNAAKSLVHIVAPEDESWRGVAAKVAKTCGVDVAVGRRLVEDAMKSSDGVLRIDDLHDTTNADMVDLFNNGYLLPGVQKFMLERKADVGPRMQTRAPNAGEVPLVDASKMEWAGEYMAKQSEAREDIRPPRPRFTDADKLYLRLRQLWRCGSCRHSLIGLTSDIDHIEAMSVNSFPKTKQAQATMVNATANYQELCSGCHRWKTRFDGSRHGVEWWGCPRHAAFPKIRFGAVFRAESGKGTYSEILRGGAAVFFGLRTDSQNMQSQIY